MKMKKIALSFSILAAVVLFAANCKKKEKNVAPEPDLELQSAKDVTFAMQAISDIDILCGFLGENRALVASPFLATATSVGPYTPQRDTTKRIVIAGFNNTTCLDGHVRNGSIFMYFDNSPITAQYYRDFGYKARVSLVNYRVDDWKINTTGFSQINIENLAPAANYDPKTTNLSWRLVGDITLTHPTDSNKNMHVNFNLVKTLLNTATPTVFPSKTSAITWSLALIDYKGVLKGETSRIVPFTYSINPSEGIARTFSCTPDKIYGIGVSAVPPNTVSAQASAYHPFINGTASFTTAALYPRVIHYGQEERVENVDANCDNAGTVTIKGISYPIDFIKIYK
jgi:hypothetical protein